MTDERGVTWGPLARRLLAMFLVVALSSVIALTVAALLGTGRGLAGAETADRKRAAAQVADAVAAAYTKADGWSDANLNGPGAIAAGAGARLVVRDQDGAVRTISGHGRGVAGARQMNGVPPDRRIDVPVTVDGNQVGTVQLVFPSPAGSAARAIAWEWIAVAAVAALAAALMASWFVSRRIAVPLLRLARAARAIAAGDRSARARVRAAGELGTLAQAFDEMADRSAKADKARRSLTADVAHELRTPLAALQAGLEELRDGLVTADGARLSALHDQTVRLGRVVDDLAALSAAESAALSLQLTEVDLAALVRRTLGAHAPWLRASGLDVGSDLAEGIWVRVDPDRLHQALGNILGNAARYGRAGDRVTVALRSNGEEAVLEVADTGPGIPAEELPHIFDRLWRGRAAAAIAGSGIGLAVARELVTAQGGSLTADSMPAKGTTFTIRLRMKPRPNSAVGTASSRTLPGGA